ncbi:hypothetical protein V8G54_034610, partial [Vigna mungo]
PQPPNPIFLLSSFFLLRSQIKPKFPASSFSPNRQHTIHFYLFIYTFRGREGEWIRGMDSDQGKLLVASPMHKAKDTSPKLAVATNQGRKVWPIGDCYRKEPIAAMQRTGNNPAMQRTRYKTAGTGYTMIYPDSLPKQILQKRGSGYNKSVSEYLPVIFEIPPSGYALSGLEYMCAPSSASTFVFFICRRHPPPSSSSSPLHNHTFSTCKKNDNVCARNINIIMFYSVGIFRMIQGI